ncbi:MAG: YHS domain-containing protein [Bacteroidota bacterium]
MVRDPVCGMQLDEQKANEKSEYQGKSYFFCSSSCKAAFDKNPSSYIKKEDNGSTEQHGEH